MVEKKFVIISPVRNEEEYVEKTINSVVNQTILPLQWIIVNDGSTDNTEIIIEKYIRKYNWIYTLKRPSKQHSPGAGVVDAFYAGYELVKNKEWEFIVKLDGDLEFGNKYFENLLNKFELNPKLGMASGTTYEPKNGKLKRDSMPLDHVRGAAKMYRKECWEKIEGIERILGWDTIDELKAQVNGWETRSFKELVLIHYKPIGFKQKNILKREIKAGERQYYLGYLGIFAFLRGFYRMLQKPYIIAGFLNIVGYSSAKLFRKKRIPEKKLIKHLRKKQWARLTFGNKLIN